MNSAIGNFDSSGVRLAALQTPEDINDMLQQQAAAQRAFLAENYTDQEANDTIARDNEITRLHTQLAELETQLAALRRQEIIITLPQRLESFDTYELQNVVDLIYALVINGVNWGIIKDRLAGVV